MQNASEKLSTEFYSQYGQDRHVIEDLFPGKSDGVFVDVGAYDGISISNTYALERLGWSGLCIEPNPNLKDRLTLNRPKSKVYQCAAYSALGDLPYAYMRGPTEVLNGLRDDYPPQHWQRVIREHGDGVPFIRVLCLPLSTIFEREDIDHVDYLSIDTEGSELAVLQGIDWGAVSIDVISAENNYDSSEVRSLLSEKGYRMRSKIGDDEFFRSH